ncbi:pancreatic lipase-related protein 2-like [Topomyia yanbarensis]|uniref:pancreatic lipase-related protein 2-like n=1 Tax=Topomyia yanbarensis TaxID=2498891 RepID=UPI00273AA9EA|nr:pancreatic lipase-related protein 2-like [Topomyia yanbarensis]
MTLAGYAFSAVSSGKFEDKPSDSIFFEDYNCESGERYAIIVHGWNETCSTDWIVDMLSNLTAHRGGCLICMDYSIFSVTDDYFTGLVPHFNLIVENLVQKLHVLDSKGFHPRNGFLFGFSFGAQAAMEAGRRFGAKRLERIDVCEPAGPGFDSDTTTSVQNPQQAARNVQCIHTSSDIGTFRRECHQDWNMGNCGRDQPAAGAYPKGSHGLCPYFYNSAFSNEFRAIRKPNECFSFRAVRKWPPGFRMGYFTDVESGVNGDLFASTTNAFPYNEIEDTNEI